MEDKYASQNKYDALNTKKYTIKLNKKTDAEIIEWLDRQESKQGSIRAALKEHLNRCK